MNQDAPTTPDREFIEDLFTSPRAIEQHVVAPLFARRAAYLRQLADQGMHRKTLKDTAALLNHVVRVLDLQEWKKLSDSDIKRAAILWSKEAITHRPISSKKSAERFYTAANGFIRYHGLKTKAQPFANLFDPIYFQFYDSLLTRGYLPTTVAAIGPPVQMFLFWLAERHTDLRLVSWLDIREYLDRGVSSGWQPRTVLGRCQALRSFFQFAGSRGFCKAGLDQSIVDPVVRTRDCAVFGPSWSDVRRMIHMTDGPSAQERRAKVVLLLCSVYGLRSSEVRKLTIDAFDWKLESFTVKRAKNGYWQRLPITQELREAVINYLRYHRPACLCRNLVVTLRPPYRSLQNLCPIVKKRMQVANVETSSFGPHSLRHSCATELLRQGTSLRNIASLLGHRDLRSVSVYARNDFASLQRVADFNLAGVL